jgi:hypothetical protein
LSGNTITATNPCGTGGTLLPTTGSALKTTIQTGGSGYGTLTFPSGSAPGTYLIMYSYAGGASVASPTLVFSTPSANLVYNTILQNGTFATYAAPLAATTANNFMFMAAFTKTDAFQASLNIGSGANVMPAGNAATTADIFVIPLGFGVSFIAEEIKSQLSVQQVVVDYLRSIGLNPSTLSRDLQVIRSQDEIDF